MWPVRDMNFFFFLLRLSRDKLKRYRATNCNISHDKEKLESCTHVEGGAGDHFKETEEMAATVEEVCISCLRIIILKILC